MKKILCVLVLGAASLMAADGAALYKKCIACHGANGDKIPPGSATTIAVNTLSKDKIVEDLKGYREGTLDQYTAGKLMAPNAKALSDEDITALADYIVTLAK